MLSNWCGMFSVKLLTWSDWYWAVSKGSDLWGMQLARNMVKLEWLLLYTVCVDECGIAQNLTSIV